MPNRPLHRALALRLGFVVLLFGTDLAHTNLARAADAQATTPSGAQSNENSAGTSQASTPTAGTNQDNDESDKKDSVFRPTEDISEDLAVPFPVDI